ncbi:oxygen-dependent tRNA uridine(34) hydroxylase TrhO [Alicyclobacillus vulcanalis]|uniref:tRNA uridine(34) hydroxylase n=1 Tax=Alicyclobacillus vulcanalis TaxID=252246 RepID=A0A1N7KS50_9BACL|nr:rhodanese-related sulfurtransferase [Alicyclobacillus vulcanalis]SIS64419.1 UPF0176 protein [Alicyclobacillus vulcanalis]
MSYEVMLFYKFTPIDHPEALAEEQRAICESLGLRGRILVAEEGLNGTLSGAAGACAAYREHMHRDTRFSDMLFKVDPSDGHVFPRLSVKRKAEIVHFGVSGAPKPWEKTGQRLSPKAWYEMLGREDVVVIDGRNDYEYEIGHFEGALRPEVSTFREFPDWIERHKDEWRGKKVLTYCTGGIRCEKLSGYLLEQGIEEVYQLDGGIVTYGKDPEVRGRKFLGKCYVFDDRVAVRVNQTDEDVIIARCSICGQPSDRYINCGYLDCHRRFLCCEACEQAMHGFCSPACEAEAAARGRIDPRVTSLLETYPVEAGLSRGR